MLARSQLPSVFRRLPLVRVLSFGVVGTAGFAVEALILTLLVSGADWSPYSARLVSFSVAVTATWLLNRYWTFRDRKSPGRGAEYVRYVSVQASGALINLGVYSVCLFFSAWMLRHPVAALAVGAAVAMLYNYLGASHFAFRGPPEGR